MSSDFESFVLSFRNFPFPRFFSFTPSIWSGLMSKFSFPLEWWPATADESVLPGVLPQFSSSSSTFVAIGCVASSACSAVGTTIWPLGDLFQEWIWIYLIDCVDTTPGVITLELNKHVRSKLYTYMCNTFVDPITLLDVTMLPEIRSCTVHASINPRRG